MKSPFDELHIDKDLVSEFFATFARFEYAMKERGYCRRDRFGNALPDWEKLKNDLGGAVGCDGDGKPAETISYLVEKPPQVQRYVDGRPEFRHVELRDNEFGAKAVEAAKRVRNNLFHGGKHTPHSSSERDTKLVRAAMDVLESCLSASPDLRAEFEQQIF